MRLFKSHVTASFLCLTLSLVCYACASASIEPSESAISQQRNEIKKGFDLNGDTKKDAWRYYVSQNGKIRLSAKSFDFNFDGKVDFTRFYDDMGKILRDETDMDFDGKADDITFYQNNMIVRKELNLAGDDTPDVFKYYKNGKLVRLEGDRDSDGTLDYWENYRDGKVVGSGNDL